MTKEDRSRGRRTVYLILFILTVILVSIHFYNKNSNLKLEKVSMSHTEPALAQSEPEVVPEPTQVVETPTEPPKEPVDVVKLNPQGCNQTTQWIWSDGSCHDKQVAVAPQPVYAVPEDEAKAFIYQHESGNNPKAVNSIGCRGLGQACPGSKLPCGDDYACQDAWFTGYMQSRYGSWSKAREFWLQHSWW